MARLAADEGGEARERLLARAADADEHRRAARLAQHAREAADVVDGVPEEDEAHLLVLDRVVLVEVGGEAAAGATRRARATSSYARAGGRAGVDASIARVSPRRRASAFSRRSSSCRRPAHLELPVHACEVEQLLAQELAIVGVDEAVVEGAQALVPPQLQQRALAAQPARLHHQHALHDLGEVAQVEGVVRLGGDRLEVASTSESRA